MYCKYTEWWKNQVEVVALMVVTVQVVVLVPYIILSPDVHNSIFMSQLSEAQEFFWVQTMTSRKLKIFLFVDWKKIPLKDVGQTFYSEWDWKIGAFFEMCFFNKISDSKIWRHSCFQQGKNIANLRKDGVTSDLSISFLSRLVMLAPSFATNVYKLVRFQKYASKEVEVQLFH